MNILAQIILDKENIKGPSKTIDPEIKEIVIQTESSPKKKSHNSQTNTKTPTPKAYETYIAPK
jgi:hypothetical protein